MPGTNVSPGFANRATTLALQEWGFFGKQMYNINGQQPTDALGHYIRGHHETEDGWYQRIGIYWKDGVGISGRDGRTVMNAKGDRWPWSAAFISWVMKEAGAGRRFHYSGQHSEYIFSTIAALNKQDMNVGYWCYRLSDMKPSVGDIVCYAREAGVDYDNQKNGNYSGHCDIVVEVNRNEIIVVGGNVGDSVTRRPIGLNINGYLDQHFVKGELLFGLMKNMMP